MGSRSGFGFGIRVRNPDSGSESGFGFGIRIPAPDPAIEEISYFEELDLFS